MLVTVLLAIVAALFILYVPVPGTGYLVTQPDGESFSFFAFVGDLIKMCMQEISFQ